MTIGLMTPSQAYRPFRYPFAYDFYKQQNRIHWLPEEVPMGEDVKDWATKLTDNEKNLVTQIFRLFTQSDIEVSNNYMDKYASLFKPTEIKMMLGSFAAMESVHIDAYSQLLDTLGLPEVEYSAFIQYSSMKDKVDYWHSFSVDNEVETARTLAVFSAFVEGMQLFASFAMLLNFPRFNKLKSMGQIVTWSVRDESLHCEGMIRLYHEYVRETGADLKKIEEIVRNDCEKLVDLEDAFIDQAFSLGPVEGMTPTDVKRYIRFIADWRMGQLGMKPIYLIESHPLPWLVPMLNGVEMANFFEQRATEYSKGATQGTWEDVFSRFDLR